MSQLLVLAPFTFQFHGIKYLPYQVLPVAGNAIGQRKDFENNEYTYFFHLLLYLYSGYKLSIQLPLNY